ncbi:hypothetical protein [Shewanella sp. NIFS-20-20]|uniref:hypothetical protein n=1 Tax=Shewanella sp. NIFS-20-20 TaxID=2853806 RepID=UPI001C45FB19|nr:hypothetical protein [Shewanella sp. NIFS-20-20]MBV7315261.1 hypothetical protein [Shewanella sp. NIFS-20-20]
MTKNNAAMRFSVIVSSSREVSKIDAESLQLFNIMAGVNMTCQIGTGKPLEQ